MCYPLILTPNLILLVPCPHGLCLGRLHLTEEKTESQGHCYISVSLTLGLSLELFPHLPLMYIHTEENNLWGKAGLSMRDSDDVDRAPALWSLHTSSPTSSA